MSNETKSNGSTTEVNETSVRYSLSVIRKLIIELNFLQIEVQGITALANNLSKYHKVKLPHESERIGDDELFFKWSEQITRYRAAAKAAHDIFLTKHQTLTAYIDSAGSSIQALPKPLPEDIFAELETINAYAQENLERAPSPADVPD